jgi:hypothetical protein
MTASAHLEIRAGMPAEEIANLRTLTRRFHFLPLRLDYARALDLNGRLPEAEHEIQILHGLYQPYRFKLIEQQWRNWLHENQLVVRAPD